MIHQSAADVTEPYATWGHDKEDADSTSGYNLDDESDWEMDPDIRAAVGDAQLISDLKVDSVDVGRDGLGRFVRRDAAAGHFRRRGEPVAPNPQGIYIHGRGDERYTSLEYFNPEVPTDQFQIDAAIEMQGHSSPSRWNSDKLSFQVKFKSPYGPTNLNYPLFADTPDGDECDVAIRHADSRRDVQLCLDSREHGVQRILPGTSPTRWCPTCRTWRAAATGAARQVRASVSERILLGPVQRPRAARRFVCRRVLRRQQGRFLRRQARTTTSTTSTRGSKAALRRNSRITICCVATRAVESDPTSVATYQAVENMLDVDQFIDYMIVHYYAGGGADWSHNNWYATFNHVDAAGKWRFHAWDQEHAFPDRRQRRRVDADSPI